jgi:hypothetical protein
MAFSSRYIEKIQRQMLELLINDKLESIWKEIALA